MLAIYGPPVDTDAHRPFYIGDQVLSNNIAELSALTEAFLFLLASPQEVEAVNIFFG